MTTDIHPSTMGPHALAVLKARTQALKAYGINPHALVINQEARLPIVQESKTKTLAKVSKASRSLAIQSEHDIMVI